MITNYDNVRLEQDNEREEKIVFIKTNEYYLEERIGYFNFFTKEGSLKLLNGKTKDYKQFNSLMNNFFKYNEFFGWNGKVVENAKQKAKQLIKEDKLNHKQELKELQENKAKNFINNIKADSINLDHLKNKTNQLDELIDNTFKKLITKELHNEIKQTILNYFNKETFFLYDNVFNTYKEAYDFACENNITVSMIISSNDYISNEELQRLETEYIFSKQNMSKEDMELYLEFIKRQPITADSEERFYKLRDRLNHKLNKELKAKEYQNNLKQKSIEIDKMINHLYYLGMEKKEFSSLTIYYLNNEKIYSWSSGISTIQMYNELKQVFIDLNIDETVLI